MAYPMIPVVSPEMITSLFLRLLATTGIKGGEQIADVDVIINVSVSIVKSLQRIEWSIIVPNIDMATNTSMSILTSSNTL